MKAAFVYWDNRIAPVFDVARKILIVEADAGHIVTETQDTLPDNHPVQKALRLAELGVDTLVCGAISRALRDMVSAYGIRVIPFVAGGLPEIVGAWRGRALRGDAFAMPGCCRQGPRRFRGNRTYGKGG